MLDRRPRSRFRVSSRLEARVTRVVASRRIFPFLVLVTVSVATLAGFLATLVDEKDFPSFADGVWWAIVTVATVGYGDIVPTTPWGRVVGSALIIFGVTYLTFLTAIVTSLSVSTDQEQQSSSGCRGCRECAPRTCLGACLEMHQPQRSIRRGPVASRPDNAGDVERDAGQSRRNARSSWRPSIERGRGPKPLGLRPRPLPQQSRETAPNGTARCAQPPRLLRTSTMFVSSARSKRPV